MKIAFVADYPSQINSESDFSGGEVSTSILFQQLRDKGEELYLICPGASRYFKEKRIFPASLTTNPLWFIYSALSISTQLFCKSIDIIHVHGKNSLVGAALANLILQKPLVVTVRDYRCLCDLGMCLLYGEKVCGWREYFLKDIPVFVRQYRSGKLIEYIYAYIVGIYEYCLRPWFRWALKQADKIVCLSYGQEKIFNDAGVMNTTVIYNPVVFSLAPGKRKRQVFFGGRYTLGKGKRILEYVLPRFLEKYPSWKMIIAGKHSVVPANKQVVSMGQIPYTLYRKTVGESSLALVPSVWPEPFGRAALDALSMGTPVVTTNRGGLPEIVKDGIYGRVASPTPESFWQVLQEAVEKLDYFRKQIKEDLKNLKNKFETSPSLSYLNLYRSLI